MLLVRALRTEWPNQSLLSADDVEIIRATIDTALAMAEREQHMGDIYDLNPTTWSIWLVQNTIATRMGRWAAQNVSQQRALSFEYLYRWLEAEHARDVTRILLDPSTRLVLHRYKLPFKTKTAIPPPRHEFFKWRKGGRRLSDWMVNGGFAPLCSGIIELEPPKLVAPPPLQSTRESARAGLWGRVAARGGSTETHVTCKRRRRRCSSHSPSRQLRDQGMPQGEPGELRTPRAAPASEIPATASGA